MNIETSRLLVRPTVIDDASDIHQFLKDEETMAFFVEGIYSLDTIRTFIEKDKDKHFTIIEKNTNRIIGKLSFHKWFMTKTYEIGWILHKDYWGNGYITEIAKAVIKYGFEKLDLHRIIATCQPENIASKRICEKLGMRLEGTFKQCIHYKDDIWWDELFYAILAEDYKQKAA